MRVVGHDLKVNEFSFGEATVICDCCFLLIEIVTLFFNDCSKWIILFLNSC